MAYTKIIKLEIEDKRLEYVCDWRKTRNGFAHDATLLMNGIELDKATCHYVNRTWERYAYQSVCQKVTSKCIERDKECAKEQFMGDRGYKVMTAKRKEEFKAYLDDSDDHCCANYRFWKTAYDLLEKRGEEYATGI